MAAYPKPDKQRQRTNTPTFDWVRLPASGNPNPVPPMPIGTWHECTELWWAQHWSHPCAVMWRADDPAHERLALIHNLRFEFEQMPAGTVLAEMRQLEDRLGLNPKARLQLRWIIVDEAGNATEEPTLAVVREFADAERKGRKRNDPRLA